MMKKYLEWANIAATVKSGFALKRLIRDQRGIAATEMAFIIPVMMLLVVGLADAYNAFTAKRNLNNVASTVGDVISRSFSNITAGQISGILDASDELFRPFSSDGLFVGVYSYRKPNDTDEPAVDWSGTFADGGSSTSTGAAAGCGGAVPALSGAIADDLGAGDGMIVAQACYSWQPLFGEIFGYTTLTSINMVSTISYSARNAASVICDNC